MHINPAGLAILQQFEGCRLKSYKDTGGVWTIGYGATGEGIGPGVIWTMSQVLDRLKSDIAEFEQAVTDLTRNRPLTENQFSALVVFTFNVGVKAFKSSTLLKKIKLGDMDGAANEFIKWNHDGPNVERGLTLRRLAERALFVKS